MDSPELSVIVTVVDGTAALKNCLGALTQQVGAPSMEIIVPFDDTVPEVVALKALYPGVQFLPLGTLHEKGIPQTDFTRHILYDRRRAAGLRIVRGRLVAIVEDRGCPKSDWARRMVDLHDRTSYGAIGGAIENKPTDALRWAIFFCDFGRYQSPVEQENPDYVSDVNICYKRDALESVRTLWEQRYQEPVVNWALRRQGLNLFLSDDPVVIQQREPVRFKKVAGERFHWGRTFGQIRGREKLSLRSAVWLMSAPLMGMLLFVRHFRQQFRKKRNIAEFVNCAPLMIALLHIWMAGEFAGFCETAFLAPGRK